MNWNTIQIIVASLAILTIINDFVKVVFIKKPLTTFTNLWYMAMVTMSLVFSIIQNS